jgi:Tfp pilus assembly protein FimT
MSDSICRPSDRLRHRLRSSRGIGILEVVFVCAIGVVLLAMAGPPLRAAHDQRRLRNASDGLAAMLMEARRDAIRSNRLNVVAVDVDAGRVSVEGIIAAGGAPVERRLLVLPDAVGFDGPNNPPALTFDPLGRPTVLPATFRLVSRASGQVRTVQVLATGRVQVL